MGEGKEAVLQTTEGEYIDSYKEKIKEVVEEIEDIWILKQILRFIINMT